MKMNLLYKNLMYLMIKDDFWKSVNKTIDNPLGLKLLKM